MRSWELNELFSIRHRHKTNSRRIMSLALTKVPAVYNCHSPISALEVSLRSTLRTQVKLLAWYRYAYLYYFLCAGFSRSFKAATLSDVRDDDEAESQEADQEKTAPEKTILWHKHLVLYSHSSDNNVKRIYNKSLM